MAKTVKQVFKGVVSSHGQGNLIVIRLQDLPEDTNIIIEGLEGRSVQFSGPTETSAIFNDPIAVNERDYQSFKNDGLVVIRSQDYAEDVEIIIEGMNGRSVQFREPTTINKRAYEIGSVIKTEDGWHPRYTDWVVGPRSPKTDKIMLIEPVTAALDGIQTWYQGNKHIWDLIPRGYANLRMPDYDATPENEMSEIFKRVIKNGCNANAKLNKSVMDPYWSGSVFGSEDALTAYFSENEYKMRFCNKGSNCAHVRLVCDAPKGLKLA